MNDVEETFRRLGVYMGTVIAGLAIHGLIVLPIIFIVGTKNFKWRAPLDYFKYVTGVAQALLNALATASRYPNRNASILKLYTLCNIVPQHCQ